METQRNGPVLGCDIGNGFGYVSLLRDPMSDPMPLFPPIYSQYQLDKVGMPTAVYVTPPDARPLEVFSKEGPAQSRHRRDPQHLVRAIKTQLVRKQLTLPDLKAPVAVADLYAAIVRDLVMLANEELRNKGLPPCYDLSFTFPASFSDNTQLLNTMEQSIEKVQLDGHRLHVVSRLPEPAAAALDYLYYNQHVIQPEHRISGDSFTVLVYDLGYGTFDLSIVTAGGKDRPYQLLYKSGDPDVGGKDFDSLLVRELEKQLLAQYAFHPGNPREQEKIRQAAVDLKLELSETTQSQQELSLGEEDYYRVSLTRERFEALAAPLFEKTLALVSDAMDYAQARGIRLDALVLSGGSSQMPMVKAGLEALTEGSLPVLLYRPSKAVSFGCARYAFSASQAMEQITDCSYGVRIHTGEGYQVPFLIPAGTALPASSQPLTLHSNSCELTLPLMRSTEKGLEQPSASAGDCTHIMQFRFDVDPGASYQASLEMGEDYNLALTLTAQDGTQVCKSTKDSVKVLIPADP